MENSGNFIPRPGFTVRRFAGAILSSNRFESGRKKAIGTAINTRAASLASFGK